MNSSLPKVNANFALGHEIYHVFFQESGFVSRVEFSDDHYYEHEEEYAANLFAGMLLMPELSFRRMYAKFKAESGGDETDTLLRLMSYYELPYMAVLIRCLELGLMSGTTAVEQIGHADRAWIRQRLAELWLDPNIMEASMKDDYLRLESLVERIGHECVEDDYLNERSLQKVLRNMRDIYGKIRGK